MRRRLSVRGVVQGVGFRPYVWRLARELGLAGWVRNDGAGVEIAVAGTAETVAAFTRRLPEEAPPLAEIDDLAWEDDAVTEVCAGFRILESGGGPAATMIGHDTAVCPDCLAELFDPADRRWRYPFINCTQCGPRYTLTRGLPYDRAQTSMAAFPLCPDCAREYGDPADRRFHAEPTACPACGPRLALVDAGGGTVAGDPIAETLRLLDSGAIVAVKGLGGFHLACDARNAEAVARLRARKEREERPFAVMTANAASLRSWVDLAEAERALLESPERPIVLLRKRPGTDAALPGVAPGLAWLGAMLPYTPLHWLLFHEAAGRQAGMEWTAEAQNPVLVMTSANPGGEPLAIDNDEARTRLAGIADALLLHDRAIVVRCDDSVVRARGEGRGASGKDRGAAAHPPLAPGPWPLAPQFLRRARGYTPRAIRLAQAGPSVLALGGHFKNTVCITRGDEAFVSQHIGGLDNPATCAMLVEVSEHLLRILEVNPEAVAHDLHPDFFGTRHARELAERWGVPTLAVQHHHAHLAAIAAEHGIDAPFMGLALDGVGLGSDGTAWGGELLRLDGAGFERLGHLQPLPLPGGDRAAREPWRMAAAVLHALGRDDEIAERFSSRPLAGPLARLMRQGTSFPLTTGLGRCFDAAAGLLGVSEAMSYEGQAAMLLEGLAEAAGECVPLPDGYRIHPDGRLDLLPLFARLADEADARRGAALFHATLAEALAEWAARTARTQGLTQIACGGGCLLNRLLSSQLGRRLAEYGIEMLEARQVPPNDGGLSLGQAWVTRTCLEAGLLPGSRSAIHP